MKFNQIPSHLLLAGFGKIDEVGATINLVVDFKLS
jgi:hypothetical protein